MHEGHRQRIYERYLHGELDDFADHEVIELMLFFSIPRGDTNAIAHRLIDGFGSITGVLEADPRDLMKVEGVGLKSAVFLTSLPSLLKRYSLDVVRERPVIRNAVEAAEYIKKLFIGERRETLFLICMDTYGRVIRSARIATGTLDEVPLYTRDVVGEALKSNAAKVILAHNHPGGNATPSSADLQITEKCIALLSGMNIRLVDHIVIADGDYFSMFMLPRPDGTVKVRQYDDIHPLLKKSAQSSKADQG